MGLTKWLKVNKLFLALIAYSLSSFGQDTSTLTLQQARDWSRNNYPLLRQKEVIKQIEESNQRNLNKNYLPQLNFNGQATYQSEVTQIDVQIPGMTFNPPSKDQYKAVADIQQLLYDGGTTGKQKKIQSLTAETEAQRTEIELYKLRERVDQLFLSGMYLNEQNNQVALINKDLQSGISRLEAQVKNGVAFRSNLDVLKAELLKTQQRQIELETAREGIVNALGVLTGQTFASNLRLVSPPAPALAQEIKRPELELFQKQSKLLQEQKKFVSTKSLPKASLFGQVGYGRPGLNFLKNEFEAFYIAGARLTWNFSSLYTLKGEKTLLDLNKKTIDIQKETFIANTNSQLKQQEAEIKKLQTLIATDDEIIALRVKIKNAAKAQLENGVITANDYLREVNAEDLARQALIAHRTQLLQAQLNYQSLTGF